ncbi:MAG: hypothetical protein IPL89_15895 [Acidobacteria bacterium]|nr:hypothetical protein [Acidobacteriota bacterium]
MSIRRATSVPLLAFLVLLAALAGARPAAGQTYTVLYPFRASVRITSSLVEVAPGEFYGTTDRGGAWSQGSVVKVTTAGVVTTLHSFDSNTDGERPLAGLVYDAAGDFLYGTTTSGGLNGFGTVFRISPDGITFEKVLDFAGVTGPTSPEAALIKGSSGLFYGTTRYGGADGFGTVFSLDVSASPATLTTLYSFSGGVTDGAGPVASLLENRGFLYGTTAEGGTAGFGTVFKLSTSGSMEWVASFDGTNGSSPRGDVVEKGVDFFGAAGSAMFKVTNAGVLTKVHDLASGQVSHAGLTLGTDGFLYGTSPVGGANSRGSVFRFDPSTMPVVHQILHSFNGTNGSSPTTGLVKGAGGKLYGTTSEGGAGGYGASYAVDPAEAPPLNFTVFYADAGTEGAGPFSPLYRDGSGFLYGTASVGGKSVGGAIYKLDCATPPCTLATLRATQDLGMGQDFSGVVPGLGGFLYGTAKDSNSVYRIDTLNGSGFQKLYTFTGSPGNFPNGSFPIGVMERGGILYGATASGGASDKGTLFALDPVSPSNLGWSTPLSGTDGRYPTSQLVAGADGKLYGVTNGGGASDKGTLFRVTTGGTHELLHSFSGPNGAGPWAALTAAGPGVFFGTTSAGGANGVGTFFRLDATTTPVGITTLRDFASGEVEGVSVLTLGSDGNFYGTSQGWGANNFGSVIQLAPSGALRILHSFSGADGAFPRGGVLRLGDGTLLGTAEMAGPNDGGVVFHLNPASSTATAVVSGGGTTCSGGNVTLSATLTGTAPWSLTWSDGFPQVVSVSPATRVVAPAVSTIYTLTAFSDAFGEGTVSGSATITVSGVAPSAVITAPASAPPNTAGLVASVPDAGFGATYAWTVTNGTPVSGQNARIFTFTAGSGGFVALSVTVTTGPTCVATGSAATAVGLTPSPSLTFTHFSGTTGGVGATDATGTASRLQNPKGLAFDGSGNLYVADANAIRKVSPTLEVTTFAGRTRFAGAVDGSRGDARFFETRGLAVDTTGGYVYVADAGNHTIRRITLTGAVTTYAGLAGAYGGADGTGTSARFSGPSGLALDKPRDLLFVSDSLNHTIRRIDLSTGAVSTYAGVAGSTGSSDGTGADARFLYPYGLAVDAAGNLYVTDSGNATIRKIVPAPGNVGAVTTLAGSAGAYGFADGTLTSARFQEPSGVVSNAAGSVLHVADVWHRTIRRIDVQGNLVSTIAGKANAPGGGGFEGSDDGTGDVARFVTPGALALDAAGNVWVADTGGPALRKLTTPAGVVTTPVALAAALGITDSPARFRRPGGVVADPSGNIYVADTWNHTIRRIDSGGGVTTLAGLAGTYGSADGSGSTARFLYPRSLALHGGDLYVADMNANTIRKVTAGGNVVTLAGAYLEVGSVDGQGSLARFASPRGVTVDASGNVFVADSGNSTIRMVTSSGMVSTLAGKALELGSNDGGPASARFNGARGVAADASGAVYVADTYNCTIRRIVRSPSVNVSTYAGQAGVCGGADGAAGAATFTYPEALAVDPSGNVWVADTGGLRIRRIDANTREVTTPGSLWSTAENTLGADDGTGVFARFLSPQGIAVDPSGNLLIADAGNHAIRIGRPALAVAATIDSATGSVGAVRLLGSSAAATTYAWEVIRRPSGSTAALSSTSSRTPTFTPDIADLYVFRLTASDGTNASITLVSLTASSGGGCTPPPAPVITAPPIVGEDSPNRTASVANHGGSTYAWSVTNGTITAGQGTSQITFRSGAAGTLVLTVVETNAGCSSPPATANVTVAPAGQALLFYPVYPCRMYTTFGANGPPLAPGEIRTIAPAGACGIPASAKALAANATVVGPTASGHLVVWPVGTAMPLTSNLNFNGGRARANNAIVTMPGTAASGFSIFNGSTGATPLILDVSGYFE